MVPEQKNSHNMRHYKSDRERRLAMEKATLSQAAKVLTLMENISREQLQELLESGLLSDLLHAGAKGINREEFKKVCGLNRKWYEKNGVIYFTLPPTDNTTGPQWIERLEAKKYQLSRWAKDILNSQDFKPTSGIINKIAVMKWMIWDDGKRTTKNISAVANKRKLTEPNLEVICLIREMFSDDDLRDMDLVWIMAMHKPIKDFNGVLRLLSANRDGDGLWLRAAYGEPDGKWPPAGGFAFVISQVSAQDLATQN
jgi:hypothetical protein